MNQRLAGIGMTSPRTRERMVQRLRQQGIADARVLEAMRAVPRHIFVDEALASRAYEDKSLPIGFGQTISQPYTVAKMTEVVLAANPQNVLEIGTGSGYQTAVLAQVVPHVFSVERILPLQHLARTRLAELRLNRARFKHDDGHWGWPEFAPYDGILVAAAAAEVPPALMDQLAVGGRLVIPTGNAAHQVLNLIERNADGFIHHVLNPVTFVPMLGGIKR